MDNKTQATGVRSWYGADLHAMQEENFKLLDSFFGQYGAYVLSGGDVTPNGDKYDIAAGLVVLENTYPDAADRWMVVPFEGVKSVELPVFLTLSREAKTGVYENGAVVPVVYAYKAVASNTEGDGNYLEIDTPDVYRFVDAIQNATHRFVTSDDRTRWNNKEDKGVAAQVAEQKATQKAAQALADAKAYTDKYASFDYIIDSNAALAALNNNPNATNVLIKKGTWTTYTGILLHPNTKRIVGEAGNLLRYDQQDGSVSSFAGLYYATTPNTGAGYSIQGVNLQMGSIRTGFYHMVNMENCRCEAPEISLNADNTGFEDCINLIHCTSVCHEKWNIGFGFLKCENLFQCRAESDRDSLLAIGIQDCKTVSQCFSDCTITGCFNVSICQTTFYGSSYFSSAANATYACADTLNGGWNKVVTL